MASFVLLNRIFRNSASDPRLIQLGSADAEEYDMSFEDALLDSQLSYTLHADYDAAQPPPGVYNKLLFVIEHNENNRAEPEPVISLRDRVSQAIRYMLPKPSRARLVSGAVSVVMMAAVVCPYVLTTLDHSSPKLSYDYQALRASDPPETYGPRPQTKLYLGMPEPDTAKGELHKE